MSLGTLNVFHCSNIVQDISSTATSGGTTTLTINSNYQQIFTGSSAHTVRLPVVTTLTNGFSFMICNLSSQSITIQTSGQVTKSTMSSGTWSELTCIDTTGGTGTASWISRSGGAAS